MALKPREAGDLAMNMSFHEFKQNITRRHFFAQGSHVLGAAALASLGGSRLFAGDAAADAGTPLQLGAMPTHFPGKVKHIIYLHMVGGPAQMDLYDYKPVMNEWYDKD